MHSGVLRVDETGDAVMANIVESFFDLSIALVTRRPGVSERGARRRRCATRGVDLKTLKLNCR